MKLWHALVAFLISSLALILSPRAAHAQMHAGAPSEAAPFGSPVDDQHIWWHAILDQFEGRFASETSLGWDGEVWVGTDSDKLWLKSEGELTGGELENGQHEAYYSKPISTYFDFQIGARYDLDSRSGRGWGALGIEGLAPLFFHVSASVYASDQGHFAAKFSGTYDLLLTQRLILQPEIELNLYAKDDKTRAVGSGFSDLDLGLRLRYEISRKFAPYIGLLYEKKFGRTETYAIAAGEQTDALSLALGIRAWY